MSSKLWNLLLNLITSNVQGNLDSENIRRIILINIYSTVGILFMLLLGFIDFHEQKHTLGIVLFCFAAIFLFFFFYLRHTKNYLLPGHAVVFFISLLFVYLLFTGGSEKSGYLWYYALPATALFILGKKRGLQFIVVSLLLAAVIMYVLPSIHLFQNIACDYPHIVKFRFIASYLAVSILSYVFESTRHKSFLLQIEANEKASRLLEESIKQQDFINQQNANLENINKELEKLSIVASETDNAIVIAGVDGIIEWVNTGFTKLYGYTLEEFKKIKGPNVIKASTNIEILELIIECLGRRQPVVYSSPNQTKDGRNIWVQTTLTPVFDKSGEISKLVIIDSDISKIKEVEEEIIQQNEEIKQQNEEIKSQRDQLEDINRELEKLSIVARETDNSVIITDKVGNIEWVNEGFIKLWGYSLDEFRKLRGNNILLQENDTHVRDLIADCIQNKHSVVYVTPAINKYNANIWIQTTLSPILDLAGNLSRLVAIEAEITLVKEAEEEIRQQNEEIKQQNEEISTQRDSLNDTLQDLNKSQSTLSVTLQELTEKNELLTDSIQYAKLIQTSILPKEREINKYNPESFIYFQPKAIVSGDFYWFHGFADKYIIAVADCTGHGVPGAFMSMIGNTLLNRIIKEEEIYDPEQILLRLNCGIIDSLNQGSEHTETQDDGMDISVCYVDLSAKQITIACANQMAFVIQNDKLEIIKGSIYSIGGLISYKSQPQFNNQIFPIEKNTSIYLFSDGYQDQFGGDHYDKFGMTHFEKLLLSVQQKSMKEQQVILESTLNEWKGKKNQTDDILVLGIRF